MVMVFGHAHNTPLILVIIILLHLAVSHCKLARVSSSEDHSVSLDYVRPETTPFQSFKLKHGADVLVPGRRGERKGSLHDVEIVAPPLLKKTKKAKDTLLKAASVPHVGYLDSNLIHSSQAPGRGVAKPGQNSLSRTATADSKPKKPETEAQRAERINKQFEKLMQFTALLGHVDSFLYDRTRSVVKTLHRMMGDSREMSDVSHFETNELRRRRHSSDFTRVEPSNRRSLPDDIRVNSDLETDYYEPRYSGDEVRGPAE